MSLWIRLAAILILLISAWAGNGQADEALAGPGVCVDCHEDVVASLGDQVHGRLDAEPGSWPRAADGSCGACHENAATHAEDGGGEGNVFAFKAESHSGAQRSAVCLDCHSAEHPSFAASPHAAAGLACNDCHSIHQGQGSALLPAADQGPGKPPGAPTFGGLEAGLDAASATCGECHGDVLTQFQWNERHRLQEGILGCGDCHDPHGPSDRRFLGGFQQEACASCHADKDGPFIFEHGAQRVEGCVACHTPHGSPNRHLLSFQSVGDVCYSCHGAVPGFHARFTPDTVCTNCHSTIHGSNLDPAFLK